MSMAQRVSQFGNTPTRSPDLGDNQRAKDVATPRSCQSALLGAPTSTTVTTPPVGVHGGREAAADGKGECHADHGTKAGGGPRCVGEEGVGDRGTHAATQLTNEVMARCAKGANGKDYQAGGPA